MSNAALDNASLRQAFQNHVPHQRLGTTCIPKAQIWEAVAGQYPSDKTITMISHTAICPGCAEHWRLALQMQRTAANVQEIPPQRPPKYRKPLFSMAAAALILLPMLLFLPKAGQLETLSSKTFRSGQLPTIDTGLRKDTHLSRDACILKWSLSTEGEAIEYRLRVTTSDPFDAIVDVVVTQPSYQIPVKSLDRLPTNTTLLWRVTATFTNRGQIHSPTFTNILK